MKNRWNRVLSIVVAGLFGIAATGAALAADPNELLTSLSGKVLSQGPNGEQPESVGNIRLTPDELSRIKNLHATAAIIMHYSGDDWSRAQINGLTQQFKSMGIKVIGVTDAGFKPEKQVSDIETMLVRKPNIIVSIPTDPVATSSAYKKAADQGVKLVFMDNVPKGLTAGKDYVSVVSADNYGNGVAAALLMAKELKGKGSIGIVYHAADYFVTQQRYIAFKKTITDNFPDIKIVAEQGIGGPDFAGDAQRAASAMITAHRRINGIWAVWDVPAEGVIAAARTSGLDHLVITACDLGENVAINMAQGSFVKGLGAQRPYDQGVTEAILAGYGLLGKKAPTYVAWSALPVTKDTLAASWQQVYHQELPDDVRNSMR
ncbi:MULTISPECIES: substrate-binding domain-containing protein [Enterobacteriaceae]|uniref:Uncharacterized protein n=1 Tax=Klebsiella michiganensis TaxID=1134687 RepID=A0A7H5A0D5_9ENTR|nr:MULTISPECIES: substrate-binding domain-containing protein [Enterobacteriaceae]EKU3006816.1 substrate-binding domain-containing protein [Klebsiella pneumoniae]EUB41690.1 periplasmic-binding protein domain protein [Klebsiella sp. AS10]EWF80115.1 hypothetical protein L373_05883 [Klebsiella michiganensis]MBG2573840.1 substrate-binding domain-containing protein [Klebsiella sp. LTGPAF-6F]MBG2622832.1 substrate-binding domain-containing protein [Klebsiella michiganensis]